MSLRPQTVPSVPEETARIARAAFPKGNLYMQIRDEIGILLPAQDNQTVPREVLKISQVMFSESVKMNVSEIPADWVSPIAGEVTLNG